MSDAPPTTPPGDELADSTLSEEAVPPGFPVPEDPVLAGIAAGFPSVRFDLLHNQHVAFVPGDDLVEFATAARDAGFESCMDVTAVDHLRRRPRFDVVYQLLSMQHVLRLRIRVGVAADDPTLPTLTDVYAGANFYEREVFDMFGIVFAGHPDLTRILMPDDWEGHPLRKDYPVGSVPVQFKSSRKVT